MKLRGRADPIARCAANGPGAVLRPVAGHRRAGAGRGATAGGKTDHTAISVGKVVTADIPGRAHAVVPGNRHDAGDSVPGPDLTSEPCRAGGAAHPAGVAEAAHSPGAARRARPPGAAGPAALSRHRVAASAAGARRAVSPRSTPRPPGDVAPLFAIRSAGHQNHHDRNLEGPSRDMHTASHNTRCDQRAGWTPRTGSRFGPGPWDRSGRGPRTSANRSLPHVEPWGRCPFPASIAIISAGSRLLANIASPAASNCSPRDLFERVE